MPRVVHDPRYDQLRLVQRNVRTAFTARAGLHPPAIDEHYAFESRHQHRQIDVIAGDSVPGAVVQQILAFAEDIARDFHMPIPPPVGVDLGRHDGQTLIEQYRASVVRAANVPRRRSFSPARSSCQSPSHENAAIARTAAVVGTNERMAARVIDTRRPRIHSTMLPRALRYNAWTLAPEYGPDVREAGGGGNLHRRAGQPGLRTFLPRQGQRPIGTCRQGR